MMIDRICFGPDIGSLTQSVSSATCQLSDLTLGGGSNPSPIKVFIVWILKNLHILFSNTISQDLFEFGAKHCILGYY